MNEIPNCKKSFTKLHSWGKKDKEGWIKCSNCGDSTREIRSNMARRIE